jgi:hypothetical protein
MSIFRRWFGRRGEGAVVGHAAEARRLRAASVPLIDAPAGEAAQQWLREYRALCRATGQEPHASFGDAVNHIRAILSPGRQA